MSPIIFVRAVNRSSTLAALSLAPLLLGAATANALIITPVFDSSITGNANAAAIEGSIDAAITTLEGLYTNNVNLAVDFTYDPAAAGNLLSTSQYFLSVSYSSYVSALTADLASNPNNAVLSTALANLSHGNDANGSKDVAITTGLAEMLGFISSIPSQYSPVININSNQPFGFSQPVSSSAYDLTGGLEHELDEVLGGGGGGSTLNSVSSGYAPLNGYVGPLDLYRYSAALTPSFTTSGSASSYLSINGGATSIVAFNQNSSGDYGDFAPVCNNPGSGQLVQNAFNCTGAYEAYTASSPEATMLQAIGWNTASSTVPEPATIPLLAAGLLGLRAARQRRA
ncbi:MAG: NF038122 family metalloprotease [Methylococcales bacterium]|nr:NF038122 family metalloprotease [Methylococcales bacterium]